ncbi:MAG: DUF2922 domain-containing protein [Gudongella sp.]|nr:DUF2922 domain-containing protein [Gudongella sp.]
MEKTKLEMDYIDAINKSYRMSIDNPREDLVASEVADAMEMLVNAGVFRSTNGDLTGVVGARIVTTTVNELEI